MLSSCDVRNPSKKNITGTRASSVATCATSARSCASCTDDAASIPQPTIRALITSEWSPKIDRACVAIALAAIWKTQAVSSPAILYMLGSISSNPCEAVKVVVRAPLWSAPCTAPAAPPSDCICWMDGTCPQMFLIPCAAQASASSAIVDDGVIGKIAKTSLTR